MKRFLAVLLVCGVAGPALAETVYESIPDLTDYSYSEYCSPCGGAGRVYDRFSLAEATRLDGASFTVSSWYNWPSDVTLGIFAAAGIVPGTSLASFSYAPADTTMADTLFGTTVVTVDFADFVLDAGSYFFSVVGVEDLAIPSYLKPGAGLFVDNEGFYDGETTGFRLTGRRVAAIGNGAGGSMIAVPEPRVWALLVIGFGLVGAALRFREGRPVAC